MVTIDVSRYIGTVAAASSRFFTHTGSSIAAARVYDVGQGDCIGVESALGELLCYVDYGGLGDHPDRTAPQNTPLRLPVVNNGSDVPIVLTHWDKDHWWSAWRKNPGATKVGWLVPRQWIGPSAARFAARLARAECWPEQLASRAVRFQFGTQTALEIRKCALFDRKDPNQDRNKSGLVAKLLVFDDSRRVLGAVLLPGDCPYDWIPGPGTSLTAALAFHHGSRVGFTKFTAASIQSETWVGFSYGNNRYGHPCTANYEVSELPFLQTPECRESASEFFRLQP